MAREKSPKTEPEQKTASKRQPFFVEQFMFRSYLLELLRKLGLPYPSNRIAVIARLTEVLALNPDLALDFVLKDFAEKHGANVTSVEYIIDKSFNMYDPVFVNRLTAVTGTHPVTPKDALCDLAVRINRTLYEGKGQNA